MKVAMYVPAVLEDRRLLLDHRERQCFFAQTDSVHLRTRGQISQCLLVQCIMGPPAKAGRGLALLWHV